MLEYQQRPPFFAVRFMRLLAKSAAAMHIGPDGCYLLCLIVGQEDACRYTRPVNFWNHQLATLMGLRGADEHALRRVRDRCIRAGWLQYRAGNKRQSAAYFVTIPAAVSSLPDGTCDESPQEYRSNTAAISQEERQESGENPAGIRRESGENPAPSSPNPIPNPIPKDNNISEPMARPTLEQVKDYINLMGYEVSGEEFMAYNESKGWVVGKAPMKDWKRALTTWHLKTGLPIRKKSDPLPADPDWDRMPAALRGKP